jgi:hypothetical protein
VNDAWGYTDENDQSANLNNGPKPLRDAYEAQKKANDELMKRLAALEAQNARNMAADLIEAQGVARSAAKYYQGEADPEKVTTWVNDLRSAFGAAPAVEQTSAEPVLNSDDQAKYQKILNMGANSAPVGNMETAMQSIMDATSTAERVAAFARMNG